MRAILGGLLLAVASDGAMGGALPPAVWPPPQVASCTGSAGSAFSSSLSFRFSGHGENSPIARNASARYLPILTKGAQASGEITSISVFVDVADERLGLGTDYAYAISVTGSEVHVSAHSPFGVAYGLETLSQFIAHGAVLQCETISVTDEPAFAHRGLSIDSARRFYPVELIKQTLIGLAMTKQNVLHLHLSDSPCWRVESKIYPQLTRKCPMVKGAMNEDGMFYSQADIAYIVQFARVRGIRVIPEFDVPGHAGGLCSVLADEGLQCCLHTGARGNDDQIVNDDAGVGLKVVKAIFTEMSQLFPDEVMHVGCDETTVVGNCTLSRTRSFEEEILKHVASLGKAPMAWEEALTTGAAYVAPSMTLQLWTPRKDVTWTNATELGFNVLRSDFNIFYLDYDRRGTAEKMWFNITADARATPTRQQIKRVHGGESAMWGDAYTHSGRAGAPTAACMFPGSRDADFAVSAQGCIWPRAAVAAGTWWGFNNHTKGLDLATFNATHSRLVSRGIASCPCSTLTTNGCNQALRCGKAYCDGAA
jgi:hexosaminidase